MVKATPKQQQIDPEIRRAKLNQQVELMRKLRADRKRLLDIWSVYRSEMYPRHFRSLVPSRLGA